MCLLIAHLVQCRSSLCLHPESGLLRLCFYRALLWLQQFLWGGCRREVFALSSLCVWSQRQWRCWQMILLPQGFFACTSCRIWRIAKICDVVNQFVRKPFWFFLSMFSILVLCSCIVKHCRSRLLWMKGLYLGSSYQLLLCREVGPPLPPTSVQDMTLSNLMVRFQ